MHAADRNGGPGAARRIPAYRGPGNRPETSRDEDGTMQTRRIQIGCTFTYVAEIDTPVVFHVEPRNDPDITLTGEELGSEPEMALRDYTDLYGNPCTRAILPPGRSHFRYAAVATVPDAPEDADIGAPEITPAELPDDTLLYTLPSRYCLPDVLGDEAWSRFGATTCTATSRSPTAARRRPRRRRMCTRPGAGSAVTSPTWRSRSAAP
jgi:hypothetical protein